METRAIFQAYQWLDPDTLMEYELYYSGSRVSSRRAFGIFTGYLVPLSVIAGGSYEIKIIDSSGDSRLVPVEIDLDVSGRYNSAWFTKIVQDTTALLPGVSDEVKLATLLSFVDTVSFLVETEKVALSNDMLLTLLTFLNETPTAPSTMVLRIQILEILTRFLTIEANPEETSILIS
jgi:hypothetical protein